MAKCPTMGERTLFVPSCILALRFIPVLSLLTSSSIVMNLAPGEFLVGTFAISSTFAARQSLFFEAFLEPKFLTSRSALLQSFGRKSWPLEVKEALQILL